MLILLLNYTKFNLMHQCFVIGVSGGSGSGKTTFVNQLKGYFSEEEVCLLSQDNYYKKREDQEYDENQIKNFDLPTSFRKQDFIDDVKRLIKGETVVIQEYTFNNPLATASTITYKPAKVLIIEGLFVYHFAEIAAMMDLKLFVDVSSHLKLIRRIVRDKQERNYPLDDVLYRYERHVYPSFDKYILPHKKHCDIVINNDDRRSFDRGLDIIKTYIKSKV